MDQLYYTQEEARSLHVALGYLTSVCGQMVDKLDHQEPAPSVKVANTILMLLKTREENKDWRGVVMERPSHREDYRNGTVTIRFHNASHLADSLQFAQKHKRYEECVMAIWRIIQMAINGAAPRPAGSTVVGKKDDGSDEVATWDAKPGYDVTMAIAPDDHNAPGFAWNETAVIDGKEKRGMVGGLIWHRQPGEWSMHT